MSLCQECSSMGLEEKLAEINEDYDDIRKNRRGRLWEHHGGFLVYSFGDRLRNESTMCPACLFFRQMRIEPDRPGGHKLMAYCSSTNTFLLYGPDFAKSRAWDHVAHNVYLVVESAGDLDGPRPGLISRIGMIYPMRSTAGSSEASEPENVISRPRLVGSEVDYSLLKRWLHFCKEHHGAQCSIPDWRCNQDLQGFRVIDCHSEQLSVINLPWTNDYVALSYVWGDRGKKAAGTEPWPTVVQDAVKLVKELGRRFLWIDRFCIDQDDDQEKAYLIGKMALIYEGAEFTIIAAAGSDANHGLPGVGSRGRPPQPQACLSNGIRLVSTMQHPFKSIRESVWSTRGWTYQEGVLSKRRIVFTEHQVYYECQGMMTYESLDVPLPLYHVASSHMMDDHMRSGMFSGRSMTRGGQVDCYGFNTSHAHSSNLAHEIDEHINVFSRKNLTYDGDSLAAFQGISERYCSMSNGPDLLLGIPVWDLLNDGNNRLLPRSFALGISSWIHDQASPEWGTGLIERRTDLPSWTWAGWKGRVDFSTLHYQYFSVLPTKVGEQRQHQSYCPELSLETRIGELVFDFSKPGSSTNEFLQMRQCSLRIHNPYVLDHALLQSEKDGNIVKSWIHDVAQHISLLWSELSINTNMDDMTSILTYLEWAPAGANDDLAHQFASFITVRKTSTCRVWERVGAMLWRLEQEVFKEDNLSTAEVLGRLPLKPLNEDISIW